MKKLFTSMMLLTSSLVATAAESTNYLGMLAVVINGNVVESTQNQITLDKQDDGKYGLTLKNFILVLEGQPMPVGNIVLKDIEAVTEEGEPVKQEITIEDGDLPGIPEWVGPLLGSVPVEVKAVVNGDILTADIAVPLVGQDVKVVFDSRTFQLPNAGFEEFHTVTVTGLFGKGSSDEPNNWHSFMSCTGSFASMVNSVPHTFIGEETRPGSNGSKSVLVKSALVAGYVANGTLTTGQLKAGAMTPENTDNNAFLNFANEAKDANGDPFYTVLNTLPDSISVWVKFKQGGAVAEHSYATMSAVITDGSYYQEPADKDYSSIIVGRTGSLIESTGEWQKITAPFAYYDKTKSPKGILVTFSTNADPGEGTDNDELYIDDVELVYSSYLTDLAVNGTTLPGFASDKYNYEYNFAEGTMPTADELADKISYVTGNEAKSFVSFGADNVMAITVLSADLLSNRTYTIKFSAGTNGVESINNSNTVGKTVYNLGGQKMNAAKKGGVYITRYADGKTVKSINK